MLYIWLSALKIMTDLLTFNFGGISGVKDLPSSSLLVLLLKSRSRSLSVLLRVTKPSSVVMILATKIHSWRELAAESFSRDGPCCSVVLF